MPSSLVKRISTTSIIIGRRPIDNGTDLTSYLHWLYGALVPTLRVGTQWMAAPRPATGVWTRSVRSARSHTERGNELSRWPPKLYCLQAFPVAICNALGTMKVWFSLYRKTTSGKLRCFQQSVGTAEALCIASIRRVLELTTRTDGCAR